MTLFDEIRPFNAPSREERLANLSRAMSALPRPNPNRDVNNHIHTCYSFSPYSPTAAVYMARRSGLITCGIMDHDTLAGAREFIEAGKLAKVATTVGIECRAKYEPTSLRGRHINNPDQAGVIYMAMHGIPHGAIEEVDAFFAPYRAARAERNRAMVANINRLLASYGLELDYDRDVESISMYAEGGTVTERHIAFALAAKLLDRFPAREELVGFLRDVLGRPVSSKIEKLLMDKDNPYVAYDLLGWIKSDLVSQFFIPADAECPDVSDVLALSERVGAISAYPYLGDVGDSVTGDKRAQKFEDEFLYVLLVQLKQMGFRAITYMPSRNTFDQLDRLRTLCENLQFFQISGEDINSPRQQFICEQQRNAVFNNLHDSTWALIAHEWLSTADRSRGLFSPESEEAERDLTARTGQLAKMGKRLFL